MNMTMGSGNQDVRKYRVNNNEEFEASVAFNKNNSQTKEPMCFVTAMTYGGVQLKPAFNIMNPIDDSQMPVIGVVTALDWGGTGDEWYMTMRVDADSMAKIEQASIPNKPTLVEGFEWEQFAYNHGDQQYYVRTKPNSGLKAIIAAGTQVDVSTKPMQDIEEPVNFEVSMTLRFKDDKQQQEINCASSADAKTVVVASVPLAG